MVTSNYEIGYKVGRAERDAEVAAHLRQMDVAQLMAARVASAPYEAIDESEIRHALLADLLAWLEVGEVETPSPEPPADEKDSE